MEKLIELLDKFRRENKTKELFGEPGTLVPLTGKDFIELNRVMIISKEYEFIKWLVNENKIDYEKVRKGKNSDSEWDFGTCQPEYFMIMLLSVQDKPIDFLISILK